MELTILTPRVVVLGPLLPSAAGSQEGLHCSICRQQQSHHLDDKPVVHHQLVFHHDNSQESTPTRQGDAKGGSVLLQLLQSPGQAFHLSAVPDHRLVIFRFRFLSSLTMVVWRW